MKTNLFLTGKPRVGKTTILKKVIKKLELVPGGFMVDRDGKERNWLSFYMLDARDFLFFKNKEVKKRVFAWREIPGEKWNISLEVFNEFGSNLLKKGYDTDIIIMDELGRFELKADKFKKSVVKALDSPYPVMGILKDEKNPFLDSIRERNDVILYRVTEYNREEVYLSVLHYLNKMLKNK